MPKPIRLKRLKKTTKLLTDSQEPTQKKGEKFKGFCNAKPLRCCKLHELKRDVGLYFSEEFTHLGLNQQSVECVYETVTVNTATYGGPKKAEDVDEWRKTMTEYIVRDIDKIVEELGEHRNRLLADLAEAQGIPF